jgi:hypothetical protein
MIIIICIIIYNLFYTNKDNFTSNFYGFQCNECNNKNIGECLKCNNCGIFYNTNKQSYQCIKGDKDGPYENIKTKYWLHNDPFSRYINENKWLIETPYKKN